MSNYVYKLFKNYRNHYLFDTSRNKIHKISKSDYFALNNETLRDNHLDLLEKKGIVHKIEPNKVRIPFEHNIEYYYSHRVAAITLQVTQMCNFRCTYCVYSESKNELQRTHTKDMMSFDVAKAAIDFLISHSCDEEKASISFYGGEPLLNFKLIKECLSYISEKYPYKKIVYSMTTNGYLLTEDIISFLVKHNFNLTISLDGPQTINDKNRRLALDGTGTFDVVKKKLLFIRERYPEFYKTILISSVLDYTSNLNKINEFFFNDMKIHHKHILMTGIDSDFTSKKSFIPYKFYSSNQYELFKALVSRIWKDESIKYSPLCDPDLDHIDKLSDSFKESIKIKNEMYVSGPCTPGIGRLFITVNGDLFPCERVSETSEIFNLGNIFTDFNIDKIKYLLNIYNLTKDKCLNCWGAYHCNQCIKYADNKTNLSAEKRLSNCSNTLLDLESKFNLYLMYSECLNLVQNYENKLSTKTYIQ